jgi:hypothetical protein
MHTCCQENGVVAMEGHATHSAVCHVAIVSNELRSRLVSGNAAHSLSPLNDQKVPSCEA